MHTNFLKLFIFLPSFFILIPNYSNAANLQQYGLSIQKIRSVGDYEGQTFDSTIELWFTAPLNWPSGSACTTTFRVFIDAKHKQLISAALLALATGRKVDINVDDSLPIRSGSCEVSFLDVSA
ncbi:MAG: hypothetical protein K2Q15_03525 [Burkholderiales bacterium]|nr:hypothetical protein [Burkholderiales bacterium]